MIVLSGSLDVPKSCYLKREIARTYENESMTYVDDHTD